ncbi:MAG TPA: TrkA family potassium uptake protein [Caproiciproducens sp.]|jgi:K+ transport systems, NAD-binding component|nr:TrkA family potassium uptake protein [Caproiciproducens sp.]
MKVIIIGGGQVGVYIANLLLGNKCTVKVIENREAVFEKLKKDLPKENIVFGSGTNPAVLESVGIADADVVAAVTGSDETNLVASTIAKFEFGVPRVIARVNNPKNSWMFNAGMGVDIGLNQADLMAHLVIEGIDLKNILTLMKINRGEYSIVQVSVDSHSQAVRKPIKELVIPSSAVLIAISRGESTIIPRGDTVIYENDNVLALADESAQAAINELFGSTGL